MQKIVTENPKTSKNFVKSGQNCENLAQIECWQLLRTLLKILYVIIIY